MAIYILIVLVLYTLFGAMIFIAASIEKKRTVQMLGAAMTTAGIIAIIFQSLLL